VCLQSEQTFFISIWGFTFGGISLSPLLFELVVEALDLNATPTTGSR
jgi:hypothetical protein